jgi:hypothetical protein
MTAMLLIAAFPAFRFPSFEFANVEFHWHPGVGFSRKGLKGLMFNRIDYRIGSGAPSVVEQVLQLSASQVA